MFYQLIDNPYTFESSFSFEESAFTELAKWNKLKIIFLGNY